MMESLGNFDNYIYVTLITLLAPQLQKIINKCLDLFNTNIDTCFKQLLNYFFKESFSKYSVSINYYSYYTKSRNCIETENFEYYNSISKKLVYYMNDYKDQVINNDKFNIIKTNNFYSENTKNSVSSINSNGIGDGTNISDILIKVKYDKIYYKDGEKNKKIV